MAKDRQILVLSCGIGNVRFGSKADIGAQLSPEIFCPLLTEPSIDLAQCPRPTCVHNSFVRESIPRRQQNQKETP